MIPFVGPSYSLALRKADIQRSINMHLVGLEAPGKAPFVLQSIPGLTLFTDLGAPVRGMLSTNDRTFVVAGQTLWEVFRNGTSTNRGTLASLSGPVEMTFGISQLVIVDGDNGYVLVLSSNVFSRITSDAFYGSDTVSFLDNFFLFVRPDTGEFYISAINDATTLDALDFATAESQPDDLVAIVAVQRRLLLLGAISTEVWFDSGNVDFPFEREGATIEVGCMAPHSVREVDNSVFWIGRDKNGAGIVYRLNGYQAQRISSQGVEQAIQRADLASAVAYCYQENGLTFYAINAPGLSSTWVYEISTGSWHERTDLDELGQYAPHRAVCHTYAFGRHVLGGADGALYFLDSDVRTNAGDPLVRERISPHSATPSLTYAYFDAFHLDCTTGDAPQDADPHVELFFSDDSGATWSDAIQRSTGKVGERFARVTWRRLGRARDRVWKLRFSDVARFDIVNVQIESRPGTV
jgi:hypothetical protein